MFASSRTEVDVAVRIMGRINFWQHYQAYRRPLGGQQIGINVSVWSTTSSTVRDRIRYISMRNATNEEFVVHRTLAPC